MIRLILLLLCFLSCLQLPAQNRPSGDPRFEPFQDYAERVENLIQGNDVFAGRALDSLKAMATQLESPFTSGVALRLEAKKFLFEGDINQATSTLSLAKNEVSACCASSEEMINILLLENNLLINLGLVNFDTVHFKKGKEKVEQALIISKNIQDTTSIINCLDGLGDYYYYSAFQVENMDSSRHYYEELLRIDEGKTGNLYKRADALHGLACVHNNIGNIELAQDFFYRSLSLAKENDFYDISFALYNDFAEKYDRSGDYEKALSLKLEAYPYVSQSGSKEFLSRMDRELYRTYKSIGNYREALYYYEKYQDSIAVMNKQEALALRETIEIQDGIARQEKAILNLEIKNANTRRNFFLLLGAFLIFTIGFSMWTNLSLRRKNKVLEAQKREIVLAQLMGQNNERRRMAGELHDNLNTKIAAIRWQLEALQAQYTGKEQQRLDKIIFQLTDVYEDVRLIAQNMMPDIVEEIGLIKSLQSLIETLNDANKVKFHLVTDIKEDNFSRQISYPLYNIIFEMINNILKHAQANNAWVSISRTENEKINVSVNDDGIGFSEENIVKGYGLKNITARVDNLNGHWQIESAPQKGTKILIEIPDMY